MRGFCEIEHTPAALENACASPVSYIEVDTRSTKDRKIILYHDATGKMLKCNTPFHRLDSGAVGQLRYRDGQRILSLRHALEYFKENTGHGMTLCIDIKDYGFEEDHLSLVHGFNLQKRVCFVSWIPQTLIRLFELDPSIPLILSHVNLSRFGTLGGALVKLFSHRVITLGPLVLMGSKTAENPITPYSKGYQHGYISTSLPEKVIRILQSSRGGICVHKYLVNKTLMTYCRENDIALWIFSVKTRKGFLKYAQKEGIDVVFCDDVSSILRE